MVWTSRDQFVTLVDREGKGSEPAGTNRHPVLLSGSKLRSELGSLQVKLADEAQPTPLFGEGELENLGEQIPVALQQAGPDQDLVFAVIGEKPYLKGLYHKDVVTTGRVFYRENRLNLILGLVREFIREKDRRLQPFTPGSRLQPAKLSGPLSTNSAAVAFAVDRPDWIIMAIPEGRAEQPATQPATKAATPQAAQPAEKRTAPVPSPEPIGTAKVPKSIEERLRVLQELRTKGLIDEDEYRAKKESILREL